MAVSDGSEIFFTMGSNHVSTYQTVKITNSSSGNKKVPFSVNIKYLGDKRGWLEINREVSCGDYLSPNETCSVHVRTKTNDLPSGNYNGVLEISSGGSVFNLPVVLNVYPRWLNITPDELVFEFSDITKTKNSTVVVTNNSLESVDLRYMTVNFNEESLEDFFVVDFFKDCPDTLKSGESCTVTVKALKQNEKDIIRRGSLVVSLNDGSRNVNIKSYGSVKPQINLMESSFEECSYNAAFEVLSNSSEGASYVVTSSEGLVLSEGEISSMGKAVVSFSKDNIVYGQDLFFTVKAKNINGEESFTQSLSALNILESCGQGGGGGGGGQNSGESKEISAIGLTTREYKTCENDTMTIEVKDILSSKPVEAASLKWHIDLDGAVGGSIDSYSANLVLSDNQTDHEGKGSARFNSGFKKGKYKISANCEDCVNTDAVFVASVSCTDITLISADDKTTSLEAVLKMLLKHYGYSDERFDNVSPVDGQVFQWQSIDELTKSNLELKGTLTSKFEFDNNGLVDLSKTLPIDNKILDYYIDHCVPLIVNIISADDKTLKPVLLISRSGDNYTIVDPEDGKHKIKDLKAYGVKVYISLGQGECL